MGLKAIPMRADTGPIGGDLSHEFIDPGGDRRERRCSAIAISRRSRPVGRHRLRRWRRGSRGRGVDVALMLRPTKCTMKEEFAPKLPDGPARRLSARGIEVGHIFNFGTKYSEADELPMCRAPTASQHSVSMGSYGIGAVAAGRRHHRGQP
jgi:prolyl-tRNA synthetase